MSFSARKFLSLLFTGIVSTAVWFLSETLTAAFAGNFLGESALSGMSLIAPFTAALFFVTEWLSFGTAILYSRKMGSSDARRAQELFTTGFLAILLVVSLFTLFLVFGIENYLGFLGAEGEGAIYAAKFLKWYVPAPILVGLLTFMIQLDAAEGDTTRCTGSGFTYLIICTILTYAGLKAGLGLEAAAISVDISLVFAVIVLMTHFRAPTNTLKFVCHFAFKDLREILKTSFGDSSQKLSKALMAVFLTKFVIMRFGSELLPVLQVAITLMGIGDLLDGIPGAIPSLVSVYYAENNPAGVRRVMKLATAISFFAGLFFAALLIVYPTVLTSFLGIDDSRLKAEAITVIRLLAPVLIAFSLATLYSGYFACIEKSAYSLFISLGIYLLAPVSMALTLVTFSEKGLWLGLMSGPYLALLALVAIIIFRHGRAVFPLLLDQKIEKQTTSYTLSLTDTNVVEVPRQIAEKLKAKDNHLAQRTALLVEEALLAVRDRNAPKKVLAEVSLIEGENARLIFRDDGVIFDITDTDQRISSLRSFVVANLMEHEVGRENLTMTGFNRNIFFLSSLPRLNWNSERKPSGFR